jgi:hypothetical protein
MTDADDNLLFRLHKLAWRQDENFHTEALVHLLRYLLKNESSVAFQILKKITGERLDLTLQHEVSVNINTRVRTPRGYYPDIEIKTGDYLIYIEVKVEREHDEFQVKNYRQALEESGFKSTALVLLTKLPVADQIKAKSDGTFRWYQLAEWLECELEKGAIHQTRSVYLVEQFLEFLKQRGLTVEQVSKELIRGVESLLNLRAMLEKALDLAKAKSIKFDIESEWVGYFFKSGTDEYWLGLRYDRPNGLLLEEKTDKISFEQINADKYYWGDDDYWYLKHELDLSSIGFFELSKDRQLQRIEQFLAESLNTVKQVN